MFTEHSTGIMPLNHALLFPAIQTQEPEAVSLSSFLPQHHTDSHCWSQNSEPVSNPKQVFIIRLVSKSCSAHNSSSDTREGRHSKAEEESDSCLPGPRVLFFRVATVGTSNLLLQVSLPIDTQ